MKKCIVIPDSFKGTMTSMEVCNIMASRISLAFPDCKIISIPIADGGEGTVDCFLKAKAGEKINAVAQDAYGVEMAGFYGRFDDTAVIEMAAVAGMISNTRKDTMHASTYGVGQLIRHAVQHGAGRIIIGLGGSCTSDAGCGMAAALGTKFYDEDGCGFIPVGGTLHKVRRIDTAPMRKLLKDVQISCICDTNKVMYGPDGAAYVYGPQKGATKEEVEFLDLNLRQFAEVIKSQLGVDVSGIAGGGAAGAMGAGAVAFMGAELKPGIDYIMDIVGFDDCLKDCDCVFTGEGSFDMQSLSGKAVCGIAERAAKFHVPAVVVAGRNKIGAEDVRPYGIAAVYETAHSDDFNEICRTCREDLSSTMDKVLVDINTITSLSNYN